MYLEAAPGVRIMRDLTRGGLATTLNELAKSSQVSIRINEEAVPVRETVRSACEIFGLDPLYVANEGKIAVIVPKNQVEAGLHALKKHTYGREAAIIGKVQGGYPGKVYLETAIGGSQVIGVMVGGQLPRIC
ncbi:MAG: AIR synthase-related protein [Desulfitobacteriaceae bacterium]|nr:AIR synthase-related protein [Desulfitobacteriaceae bacterium]